MAGAIVDREVEQPPLALPVLRARLPVVEVGAEQRLHAGELPGREVEDAQLEARCVRVPREEVGDRGLLVLETFRTGRTVYQTSKELGVPYSSDAGWIDRKSEPDEITANLQALEEFTLVNRFALAVATAQRETIERLIAWSKDIETRGIALAPVTGLTECVDLCAERVRKAMVGGGGR